MKKKVILLLCAVSLFMLFPFPASADTGPKPSVKVSFKSLGDELCYATLLSKTESTGPASVWDGTKEDARHNENEYYSYSELDYKTWKAFVDYEDSDGFYFLQLGWRINETKSLDWAYYPPEVFKILLYFPESNTFAISKIYERYAFDSYFTVDMSGSVIAAVDRPEYTEETNSYNEIGITAEKSYNIKQEILSLIIRIAVTVMLEAAIALIFGYRNKKQLLLIFSVNAVTQLMLNISLNAAFLKSGYSEYIITYALLELAIFIAEAVIYSAILDRLSDKPKGLKSCLLYALCANACSLAVGLGLARLVPVIF
ncbi:MAG: hypothetical protein ACI4F7_11975 [Acutalibacteraceae bacterium]